MSGVRKSPTPLRDLMHTLRASQRTSSMIIRRVVLCSRHTEYRLPTRIINHGAKVQRRLSTAYSAPVAATHTAPSQASPLASITSELDKLTPRFDVSADDIEIIRSPSDFFEALKSKITKARRRVYLSTLYVGKTEHELVGQLEACIQSHD